MKGGAAVCRAPFAFSRRLKMLLICWPVTLQAFDHRDPVARARDFDPAKMSIQRDVLRHIGMGVETHFVIALAFGLVFRMLDKCAPDTLATLRGMNREIGEFQVVALRYQNEAANDRVTLNSNPDLMVGDILGAAFGHRRQIGDTISVDGIGRVDTGR